MPTVAKSSLAKLEKLVGKSLSEASNDELRDLASKAVEKVRGKLETDLLSKLDLVESLELRGELYRSFGEFDQACVDYEEALSLLKGVQDADEVVGRVCGGLAVSYELSGDNFKAKSYYKGAVKTLSELDPKPVLEIAELNNNLAFIYEGEDEHDQAENCFLDALKSCYEEYGSEHRQTAVFYNNLGGFYFKLEHDEQAGKMHEEALKARVSLFGESHVETAQSYANLALVSVRTGKVEEGLARFEKALGGFESDLEASRDDYEIVAANYRDVLASMGNETAIKALDERLQRNGCSQV